MKGLVHSKDRQQPLQRVRRGESRRRVLQGMTLLGTGLAAGVVACGREETPQARPTTAEPKRGGIVRHTAGFEARPPGYTFDPHTNQMIATTGYRLFYQGLLAYHLRTYEIEPEIAQRWEQPSATELLLTLQPGVRWQNKPPVNGRELTVEDILFSFERIRTNNPRFINRSLFDTVDRIEPVSKTALKVTTKWPDAALLMKFAADGAMVLAPEVIEKVQRFNTPEEAVGTGPFILKSKEDGVGAEFVRNPDYWKPGLPYLDGIRTHYISDQLAEWAAFLGGQLDIAQVPASEVKRYIAQQGPGYTPDWYKDQVITYMSWPNLTRRPFDDRRVTKALRLLMDHEAFLKHMTEDWRGGGRNGSMLCAALEAWDLPHEEYYNYLEWKQPKDQAVREAMTLLTAAGFTRDNPLRFTVQTYPQRVFQPMTELLQAQWKQFSQGAVEVEIRLTEFAHALQLLARGEFDYFNAGITAVAVEPDTFLASLYRTGGSVNYMKFSDPRLDEMIDRQGAMFNLQERKALVKEIIRYYIENGASTIPVLYWALNAAKPHVRNYMPEQIIFGRIYEHLWLDV